jgi:hypothetical protein
MLEKHDQSEAAKRQIETETHLRCRSLMTASSGISDALGAPQLTAFSPAYTDNESGTRASSLVLASKQKNRAPRPRPRRREVEMEGTRRRLLVVFPMAERTTTGVSSGKLRMRPATSRIRSADASDEPPNFMTTVNPAWAFLAPAAAAGASSVLRTGGAVDPVWQRTARPLLRLQHCGPGFALAGAGRRSLPSLEAATGASRDRDSLATPGKRSAAAISERGRRAVGSPVRERVRATWGTGSAEEVAARQGSGALGREAPCLYRRLLRRGNGRRKRGGPLGQPPIGRRRSNTGGASAPRRDPTG